MPKIDKDEMIECPHCGSINPQLFVYDWEGCYKCKNCLRLFTKGRIIKSTDILEDEMKCPCCGDEIEWFYRCKGCSCLRSFPEKPAITTNILKNKVASYNYMVGNWQMRDDMVYEEDDNKNE